MKVLICGAKHETHTFSNRKTDWLKFQERELVQGDEIIVRHDGKKTEIGGMIDGAKKERIEIIPGFVAHALPSGLVTSETLTKIIQSIENEVKKYKSEINGILLELHGAMVAEKCDDPEGMLLQKIREIVGPKIPIVATLDLHSNTSDRMVRWADMLIGFDTYPHQDMYERGFEAATMIGRICRKELTPSIAICRPPLLLVPQGMYTNCAPMKLLLEMAHDIEQSGEVVQATVAGGFPYSDVPFAGMSVVITTDGDLNLAQKKAREIATVAWEHRQEFMVINHNVKEAVCQAVCAPDGPVILVDVADNVGGGSPGDGTVLLQELMRQGAQGAVVVIADPQSVNAAFAAGIGKITQVKVGGKSDRLHGETVEIKGKVRLLSDGIFRNCGTHNTGLLINMGLTAVIECGGVTLILTSIKVPPFDPNHLYSIGIVPSDQKILVAKSAIAWRAAYGNEAKRVIEVDTPGLCTIHLDRFEYKRLRRPIFPLDDPAHDSRIFQFEEA